MEILLVAICVTGAAWFITLFAWIVGQAKRETRAHDERMEYLRLLKSSSLQEFDVSAMKAPINKNYYHESLKSYSGNGGVIDDGEYDENR